MFLSFVLSSLLSLTNASQLVSAVSRHEFGRTFDIQGTVTFPCTGTNFIFCLVDDEGVGVTLTDWTAKPDGQFKAGDRIHAHGVVTNNGSLASIALCYPVAVLSRGTPLPPVDIDILDLQSGRFDGRLVRVHGTVHEVFRDEIDPGFTYLLIGHNGHSFYAATPGRNDCFAKLKKLVGAEVSIIGACDGMPDGKRQMIGKLIAISTANDISVLKPPPPDPFEAPDIGHLPRLSPSDIPSLGKRRITGRVTALWGNTAALIRERNGNVHNIRFNTTDLPHYGETIDAVGFPATDLYRLNLSNAIWRRSEESVPPDDHAVSTQITEILKDADGMNVLNPLYHGKAVILTGTIMDLPVEGSGQGIAILKCGNFTVPVDISANRGILRQFGIGCTASIAGTCIIETENWQPHSAFPHATGIRIVIRTPEDVVILSRPSWWTPQRLMVVVGILLLVLVAIFIWNRILQRVIDRKSRQLLKEQVAQIKSELRVDERTHLAVELHDTLSQNLSGVACQIAATKGTLPDGADETARYLETAERMLLSCRTELRRCLWDLRGDTLEEANFTEAIRKTLAPVAIGVETIIRFNVPRSRLSDTTAHGVLCIIRELVANAIRHGKAKTIRVAGEFHEGTLSFSVRDDGHGFDPSNCNGPAEGHFGLEGIRERIKHLDGTFTITSEIGKGTRAEVTLTAIQPKDGEPEA